MFNTLFQNSRESLPRLPPRRHENANTRAAAARAAMALSKLSGDEQCIIFSQLCNVLDTRVAVAFSSTSSELRELTQALLQQLRTDHEVAAALGRKAGMRSCKELREARYVSWYNKVLSSADLATLGTLGSVLPALETLYLFEKSAGPDGMQRLMGGLGAGTLLAVRTFWINGLHMGLAGASAFAAALGRGALPRLKTLNLDHAAIGDAALAALAPALRRLPALENLGLNHSPFGDEGLAALVAPPPPAAALSPPAAVPPPIGVLTKLKQVSLDGTQITDASCTALAAAHGSGALPALKMVSMFGSSVSAAAKAELRRGFRGSGGKRVGVI